MKNYLIYQKLIINCKSNNLNEALTLLNKPIYTRSIGKWKKYENKISKIFPILDPWVNKFNYLK